MPKVAWWGTTCFEIHESGSSKKQMLYPFMFLHFHRILMNFSNNRKLKNAECCLVRNHLFWNSCIRFVMETNAFSLKRLCISTEFWCISQTIENWKMPNVAWLETTCLEIHASDFSWKQMLSLFKVLHFHRILLNFSKIRKWNNAKSCLVRNHLLWNSWIRFLKETNALSL